MSQPIIGIVCKHINPAKSTTHLCSGMVRDEIVEALFDQGATPLGICYPVGANLIPQAHDPGLPLNVDRLVENQPFFATVLAQISLCDGLIIQGGQYADPYETAIALWAYEHDIPTLGICGGQSIMASIFGTDRYVIKPCNAVTHNRVVDHAHTATVVRGTKFHDIVQGDKISVNSRHHLALVSCDSNLIAAAHDEDGHIEVIEAPDKKFYLATRFHPESLTRTNQTMRRIFTAFVQACTPTP